MLCWFTGMYFCEFPQCFLVGHVFFAVENNCTEYPAVSLNSKVPRHLGTEPTKHPCHSLAISRPSVARWHINWSTWWGPVKLRKNCHIFWQGSSWHVWSSKKMVISVYISILSDLFHEKWNHFLMFSPIVQGAPPRSDIFSHLLPICCPGPLGSPHKSNKLSVFSQDGRITSPMRLWGTPQY